MYKLMAVAVLLTTATATAARADDDEPGVCDDPIDEPIAVPWREGGIDTARGACLWPDVNLRLGGRVLVDEPDYYGTLGGDATLAVRFVEGEQLEWGLGFRVVDVAYVQNAVWKVTETSYGPVIAQGAAARTTTLAGRPWQQAIAVRLALPYTESRLDGTTGALQVAALATWQARARLRVHGRAMLLGWYGSSPTGTTSRAAVAVAADVSWRAIGWMTPTAGVDAQLGWYGLGLDHVAVRAGVRWRVKGLWHAEAAAGVPLVGSERQDVALSLGVRRDLD